MLLKTAALSMNFCEFKMKKIRFLSGFFLMSLMFLILIPTAQAHCPLCTMGAAAAIGGAVWLGVKTQVIGLFLGAFAVSTGWWFANFLQKKYPRNFIPQQKVIIILASFLLTILPLLPLINQTYPLYISWAGEYGSWLNRTYIINLSLVTSIFGGILVSFMPAFSKKITALRKGRVIPFQGVMLTLALLLLLGTIIQVI